MLPNFDLTQKKIKGLKKLDAGNLAQILEASPNEIYLFDYKTLQVEYANANALKNLGYSLEELQQRTVVDLKADLAEEEFRQLILPLIGGKVTQLKLETIHHYRSDGSSYPIEGYLQLIQAEDKVHICATIVDISQRKKAEISLQEKVAEVNSIANNIPGIIYRVVYLKDGTPQVEYVSHQIAELLEITEEEVYADLNNFLKRIHKEDRSSLLQKMLKSARDVVPLFWEGRFITASQRLMWVQIRSEGQKQPNGKIIRNGVVLDITLQKQVELALQESEAKFRQFAENVDDILWMINPEMTELVYLSPAYEKVWGRSRQEVMSDPRQFLEAIHPEDQPIVSQLVSQTMFQKSETEYRIIRPDGEIRWLRDRAFPVQNKQGEVYRIAGVAQDITEEKSAQAELSRNRELREVIFDEATDGLYLINSDDLMILDCNRRAVELLAAPNKEAILNLDANWLHQTHFPTVKKNIQEQGIWHQELFLETLNKSHFWGDVAWKKIELAEETMYLVRVTDISERKAFENELEITNQSLELTNLELARATRLKDEFLASMSHELRTPLNAIIGMSEGLQEGAFEAITEAQKQAVKTIYKSAEHLLAIINDILDLAKIQAGKVSLNITEVNIQSVCENSLSFLRQQALRKKIQLTTKIDTSCPVIEADELRMRQILINLLCNAVKFTSEGGKITLAVTEDAQQENIIFSVKDTGIGIPTDKIEGLFEPFVQLDSQLNRNYSGTGLGLSLVRRLTELHGGSVTVKSQFGKGSIFEVKLPYPESYVLDQENNSQIVARQVTNLSQPPSILMLAFDERLIDTASSYLEASGYEVHSLSRADDLLSKVENINSKVILIDLDNFSLDNKDLIEQIKSVSSQEDMTLIGLISSNSHLAEKKIYNLGINVSLIKPVRLRHLLNEIERYFLEESQP